jgi:hypothetical protein
MPPTRPIDLTETARLLSVRRASLQAGRDAEETARWRAETSDAAILVARMLARDWDRQSKKPVVPESQSDRECAAEAAEERARQLLSLADALDRFEDDREAKANGTLRQRKPVILPPRHQPRPPTSKPAPVVDVMQQSGDGGPKTKARSRTAIWEEQQAQQAQSQLARLVPPSSGAEQSGAWLYGVVQRFDHRTRVGTASLSGLMLPFDGSAVLKSGITTLHPSQQIEALVKKRDDGSYAIAEIRLSAGERAAKIAELEKQANAAEERFKLTLGRRLN